jgi:polyisoprenoid-binding protein YceI
VRTFTWSPESKVAIHANSSVHPIHGDIPVRGEATVDVSAGTLDAGSTASGFIEADVESLKSGNKLEDFELRRRLEAKKYPTMRYDVRGVNGGSDRYEVTGTLTFHGVSREFVEECTARLDGDALHVEAEHTFDIREFDVKPPKLGPLQVHPEVTISLHLVGKEAASGGWG